MAGLRSASAEAQVGSSRRLGAVKMAIAGLRSEIVGSEDRLQALRAKAAAARHAHQAATMALQSQLQAVVSETAAGDADSLATESQRDAALQEARDAVRQQEEAAATGGQLAVAAAAQEALREAERAEEARRRVMLKQAALREVESEVASVAEKLSADIAAQAPRVEELKAALAQQQQRQAEAAAAGEAQAAAEVEWTQRAIQEIFSQLEVTRLEAEAAVDAEERVERRHLEEAAVSEGKLAGIRGLAGEAVSALTTQVNQISAEIARLAESTAEHQALLSGLEMEQEPEVTKPDTASDARLIAVESAVAEAEKALAAEQAAFEEERTAMDQSLASLRQQLVDEEEATADSERTLSQADAKLALAQQDRQRAKEARSQAVLEVEKRIRDEVERVVRETGQTLRLQQETEVSSLKDLHRLELENLAHAAAEQETVWQKRLAAARTTLDEPPLALPSPLRVTERSASPGAGELALVARAESPRPLESVGSADLDARIAATTGEIAKLAGASEQVEDELQRREAEVAIARSPSPSPPKF